MTTGLIHCLPPPSPFKISKYAAVLRQRSDALIEPPILNVGDCSPTPNRLTDVPV